MEGQVKRVIVYFIALLAIGGVISYISPDIPAKFSVPNQTEEQASPAAKKPQEAWIHALSYQTSPDKDGPSERIVPGDWLLQYDANNVPQMIFTSGQQSLTIYPVPDPGIRLGATFVVSQQLINCPGFNSYFTKGYSQKFRLVPFRPCSYGNNYLVMDKGQEKDFAKAMKSFETGPFNIHQGGKVVSFWGNTGEMEFMNFLSGLHAYGYGTSDHY